MWTLTAAIKGNVHFGISIDYSKDYSKALRVKSFDGSSARLLYKDLQEAEVVKLYKYISYSSLTTICLTKVMCKITWNNFYSCYVFTTLTSTSTHITTGLVDLCKSLDREIDRVTQPDLTKYLRDKILCGT